MSDKSRTIIALTTQELDDTLDAINAALDDCRTYLDSPGFESDYEGDPEGKLAYLFRIKRWEQLHAVLEKLR